jgi:Tol biopolymer transport system component
MDATGILDAPADTTIDRRPAIVASQTTLRMDWILTALSVWLVGGFYVDIWAHAHGQVDDTFFTPWHGLLYSGAASFGVVLGAVAILGRPRSVPIRDTLAPPYRLAFLGSVLFAVAGVIDLAWHTLFGFEVDVESLLSPSHLLLATSGMLMVGGPIRAAAARLREAGPASWRTAGPLAIPLAMAMAILVAFTQYANPIADPWAEATPADEPQITAQLYAMNADGTGQRRLTVVPGVAVGAHWSPDGKQLAYSYTPSGDGTDTERRVEIHVMNADGTGDHALATEVPASDPVWSPDASRIAFSGENDDGTDVYVMNADGTGLEQLTSDAATDFAVTWTPDGSALLFNSDRNGDFDIVRLDLSTKAVTSVTTGPSNDYEPAISPDGTRIAFTSDRRGQNSYDVWLAGIDGLDPVRFTVGTNDEVGDSYMPTWSPDGTRIAFASNRTGDFEVYSMPVAGGEATNLTQNPGASDGWARPQWSPDGSTIVYPSEGNVPFWRIDYVRQGFGAAGVLIAAALLAGVVVWLRRRFGALPFGAYAVVVGAPLAMATVLDDQYRLIPGIVIGALAAELVVGRWPAGRTRVGDALVAFLIPAIVFALYFGTLMMTGGIGWSLHMWLGAIVIAGIIGLFLDELSRAARPATEAVSA